MARANGQNEGREIEAPRPARLPQRFAFVLLPDFSMIAFASAVEPLRIANRMAERAVDVIRSARVPVLSIPTRGPNRLQGTKHLQEVSDVTGYR